METEILLILVSMILSIFTIVSNLLLHLRIRSKCCDMRPEIEGGQSFRDIQPKPESPKINRKLSTISL